MIITDANGIGTELGLWPTLTPIFRCPRPVLGRQDDGESDARYLKASLLFHADVARLD
jgi:hypothetical protein